MATEVEWSVGQIAKRSGVSVATLHFYEQKGLISSRRNEGNQRRYHKDALRRVAIIKVAQRVGISLNEIKEVFELLPDNRKTTQKDWEKLAKHWQKTLQQRIHYLRSLDEMLTGCIGCGCLSMKNCPLYNAEDKAAERGDGAVLIELGPEA